MQAKSLSLEEIAKLSDSKLVGDPQYQIRNVADLENATSEDASFLANPRYKQAMLDSKAGVIFIDEKTPYSDGKNYLISTNPSQAFQKLIDTLHPKRTHPSGFVGIHPTAVIHKSAEIGSDVTISPYAVIDENVKIGNRSFIGAGCYIGPNTHIGQDCIVYPHAVIREDCQIEDRVIIQPGAIIGSCGFGYITDKQGKHVKLNQVGNVRIEKDAEIGANTTIDRSRFKSTIIGEGTKIDNLVQIAHGVVIGKHNLIIAQTGIAGSTTTGKYVILAGQVAVAGHLTLDDGVVVAGKSGVTKSLKAGKYGGIPALPLAEYNRTSVYLRNIETYVDQLKDLKQKIENPEKKN